MSRATTIKRLIALGVLVSISCSFFTQLGSSRSTPSVSSPTANQEILVTVSVSEGGELTLPDRTVLRILPGSLQKDTQVSIRKITVENAPAAQQELVIVGSIYDIDLGTDRLEKPATLEVPFDPILLPDDTEPGQVFLSFYDENKKEWVYAGGEVDINRNVVVLEISHASWWMPATWNWGAWIAVLNKILRVSIVDWIEAAQLLTDDCPQTGEYVRVDSSQARNIVQGCVERDDAERPQLRIINPKSFFFEVQPIAGGNGYPSPDLLSPGEDLKFEASTFDPSPLVIEAQMTQKSGWYLVVHMIITMLPGANQFGIQGHHIACITERLGDVSHFASAVESLLVDQNGYAAAENISKFMLDTDAVRRFITAADDCKFGPARTWSIKGIEQIGGAVNTIMSATDYIANYLAGNTNAQVSFMWASPAPPTAIIKDDGNVYLGNSLILDVAQETSGCFSAGKISYSPTKGHFLIVLDCFEGDNEAFLFNADGSNKRRITGKWDYLNYYEFEWAPDGQSFTYTRINSCCADPEDIPPNAPPEGLVQYDLRTGQKTLLEPVNSNAPSPLDSSQRYRVVNVASDDVLNVRAEPDPNAPIVGTIPPDGTDIEITGAAVEVQSSRWVPIKYKEITGWVNSSYLSTLAIEATQVIVFYPTGVTGQELSGNCWTSSVAIPRPDAWRCTSDNSIYDPCFYVGEANAVICDASPLSDGRGFKLNLTQPLPSPSPSPQGEWAWVLELVNGETCTPIMGTSAVIGQERVNWGCSDGWYILGEPQPGPIWTALKIRLSSDWSSAEESTQVFIKTVWK